MTEFLTITEVAARLKMSKSGVYQAIKRGQLPPPIKMSTHLVRWDSADFEREALERLAEKQPRRVSRSGRPPDQKNYGRRKKADTVEAAGTVETTEPTETAAGATDTAGAVEGRPNEE